MGSNPKEGGETSGIQLIQHGLVDGAKSVADQIAVLTGAEIGVEPGPHGTVLVHGVFNRYIFKAILTSRRARLFIMPHGQLARSNLKRSWKKALFARILMRFLGRAKIVFLNREEHKHSCFESLSPDDCVFIPNYVDGEGLGLSDERHPPEFSMARKISLVYWGRLDVQHKGLDNFIALARSIIERVAEIVIIGPEKDEESRTFLQECSQIFGDRFTHHSFVPRRVIWTKIPKNSVFCLLSRHEGMPLAGLEALYLGLPAIFSRQTNLLEDFKGGVVDGTPGRAHQDILAELKKLEDPEKRRANIRKINDMKDRFQKGFSNLFSDAS